MSKKLYNKALTLISNGKTLLKPLLARPSRVGKHFHPGASLLADWETYNAKPTEAPVEKDKKRQGANSSTSSPAKKPKQDRAVIPVDLVASPALALERDALTQLSSTNDRLKSSLDAAQGEIKSLEETVHVRQN